MGYACALEAKRKMIRIVLSPAGSTTLASVAASSTLAMVERTARAQEISQVSSDTTVTAQRNLR